MQGRASLVSGRRRGVLAGLLVLPLAALVYEGYRRLPATEKRAPVPALGRFAVTLGPGLHMLGGLSPSVAYAVETSGGLVLVDSGLDADAGRLKAQMAELGLDWGRVRAILLTHAHGDHCGGAQHLRAATGAKVYAGRDDCRVLAEGGPREAFFSTFHMPNDSPHPTSVDVALSGGEVIAVGEVRFRVIAAPGHTPGSVCYLMERGGLRALFSGDVIMMLRGDENPRSEIRKPLGTYSAYLAPRYRGDARAFLSTLRTLRGLPAPDLVLPGHPGADPVPQSPALSKDRWEAILEAGIRDMETLLARYEADGADFLDGHPKQILPDLYYLGDFQGAAVYGFLAASRFFLVDAPGGPGLSEFVSDRLRTLGRGPVAATAVLLTSCGESETGGLADLVEKGRVQVVAPAAGLSGIAPRCPAGTVFVPAEGLREKGWFEVDALPLAGRGVAPVAYLIPWHGKTVLFSGRIPIKLNQAAGSGLFSDFLEGRGDVPDYLASLEGLRSLKPDVWLPAVASDGQNAHLYDNQWEQILRDNWGVIEKNAPILRSRLQVTP